MQLVMAQLVMVTVAPLLVSPMAPPRPPLVWLPLKVQLLTLTAPPAMASMTRAPPRPPAVGPGVATWFWSKMQFESVKVPALSGPFQKYMAPASMV